MPRTLVEQIVMKALRRWNLEYDRASTITDEWARCTLVAMVYEREARWWGVLARYADPYSPYLRAVVCAREQSNRYARLYRRFAERAAPDKSSDSAGGAR